MAKPSKNNPGPWDDIARGAGAVKRTLIGNPGNTNGASNLDKWLKGGKYRDAPISKMPGDVAKAADYLVRKLTPLPDKKPSGIKGSMKPIPPKPTTGRGGKGSTSKKK